LYRTYGGDCSEVGRGVRPHCFAREPRSVRQGALASCRLSRGRLASVLSGSLLHL